MALQSSILNEDTTESSDHVTVREHYRIKVFSPGPSGDSPNSEAAVKYELRYLIQI